MITSGKNTYTLSADLGPKMSVALARRGDASDRYNSELLDVVEIESWGTEPIVTAEAVARALGQDSIHDTAATAWRELSGHVRESHRFVGKRTINCRCALEAHVLVTRIGPPVTSFWDISSRVGLLPETLETKLSEEGAGVRPLTPKSIDVLAGFIELIRA